MSIVVAGTVALDDIKTPQGSVQGVLGGSATYFALSARFFNKIELLAVIGQDFPQAYQKIFSDFGISTEGLVEKDGKTFHWFGEYRNNWNQAHTLKTDLNVLTSFDPEVPLEYRHLPYLFLANIDPDIQSKVLVQMNHPKAIFCDSMNFWIQHKRQQLGAVIKKATGVFLNDSEARDLTGEKDLFEAAFQIQRMGPRIVCLKKGDQGAILVHQNSVFVCPVYPCTKVKDPTGAGDSFAGGFLGYLSKCRRFNDKNLRIATAYGTIMASFAVEDFSVKKLLTLNKSKIQDRFLELRAVVKL